MSPYFFPNYCKPLIFLRSEQSLSREYTILFQQSLSLFLIYFLSSPFLCSFNVYDSIALGTSMLHDHSYQSFQNFPIIPNRISASGLGCCSVGRSRLKPCNLGVVVYTCNPQVEEVEGLGHLQLHQEFKGQPGLPWVLVSKKKAILLNATLSIPPFSSSWKPLFQPLQI